MSENATPLRAFSTRLAAMISEAGRRNFGTGDARKAAQIRHGYLLALEEVRSEIMVLRDLASVRDSPRDVA